MTALVLEELTGEDLRHLAHLRDVASARQEQLWQAEMDERLLSDISRLLPRMSHTAVAEIEDALAQDMSLSLLLELWFPHFYAARFGAA
jgi:hypothetical protein